MRRFNRVRSLMLGKDGGQVLARCTATPLALYDDPAGGTAPKPREPSDTGREAAAKILKRFGNRAELAIASLADENKDLREERRQLREKVPKEGSPVFTPDDAKDLAAFRALGKPDEVGTRLKNGDAAITRAAEFDRLTVAEKAAPLAAVNAAALKELVKSGYELSMVPGVDKDNKAIEVPHIKRTDEKDGKPVALAEFAKSNALFGPALLAKPATGTAGTTTQQQTGTQFVEQNGSSGENTPKARPAVTAKYDAAAPWAGRKEAAAPPK